MTPIGGLTGFGTHLPDGSKLVKCSRMFSLQFLQENGRISWIFISTLQLKAFYQSVKCLVCLHMHGRSLSCVQLFGTLWTIAHQALLSAGFPRQEYWSGFKKKNNAGVGCLTLLQGIFPTQGSNPHPPASPELQADSLLRNHLKVCSSVSFGNQKWCFT